MSLPEFKLIGEPYHVNVRGRASVNYYQAYRLWTGTGWSKKVVLAPCCKDLAKSRQPRWVEAHIKAGLAKTDPVAKHADCTLEQHLQVYLESLRVAGRCEGYIAHMSDRISRVNECLKWTKVSDVDGLKLKAWLARMHKEGQAIKRKGSKAKPRTFTMSERTQGYYWSNYRSFLSFLVRNDRIAANPLKQKWEHKGDVPVAFVRRAMTQDEFGRILAACEGRTVFGLSGEDRKMLYIAALYSGLRAHELSSLSPRSFSLDDDRPCILLDRSVSKRRRYDCLQLPEEVADLFRPWLAGKDQDKPLWPGRWWRFARRLLRKDCRLAGVEMETDQGRLDFHCTRVSFITRLAGTKAPVAMVMRLARLSDVRLLTERYYKPSADEATEVIESLPSLPVVPTAE